MNYNEASSLTKANIKLTELFDDLNYVANESGSHYSLIDSLLGNISMLFYSSDNIITLDDVVVIASKEDSPAWLSKVLTSISDLIKDNACSYSIESCYDNVLDEAGIEAGEGGFNLTVDEFASIQGLSSYDSLIALTLASFISVNSDCYAVTANKISVWNTAAPSVSLDYEFYGDTTSLSQEVCCNKEDLDSSLFFGDRDLYDQTIELMKITDEYDDEFYYGSLTDDFINNKITDKCIHSYYQHINHPFQANVFLTEFFKDVDLNDILSHEYLDEFLSVMEMKPEVWSKGWGDFFKKKVGYNHSPEQEMDLVILQIARLEDISPNLFSSTIHMLSENVIRRLANGHRKLEDMDMVEVLYNNTSVEFKNHDRSRYIKNKLGLTESPKSTMTI